MTWPDGERRTRARWRRFSLSLLWLSLCGCTSEYVDASVLQFAVYSDAQLSRVEAVVLDEQERDTSLRRTFELAAGSLANTTYVFDMMIEQGRGATSRSDALVRFDGWRDSDAGPKLVIRQTVRALFAAHRTSLVRVWLANSCASYDGDPTCPVTGFSCAYDTEMCESHAEPVRTEPTSAGLDLKTNWPGPDNYRRCGAPDGHCPRNCTLSADIDCAHVNGTECTESLQCASGFCARACTGGDCTQKHCCESPCDDACSFCDATGKCQSLSYESDPKNCGACGRACSDSHGRAACQGGRCLAMCDVGFDDCDGDLVANGCETNLGNDPAHCGSCRGAGAQCHYGVCDGGECLGVQIPSAPELGSRLMPAGQLYLRYVPTIVPAIVALGIHVREAAGGQVILFLVDDDNGNPGTILFHKQVQLVESTTNAAGDSFGTEAWLDSPTRVPSGPFWLGFVMLQTVTVRTVNSPYGTDRRISKDPVQQFDPTSLPELVKVPSLQDGQDTEPYLYAVYFQR